MTEVYRGLLRALGFEILISMCLSAGAVLFRYLSDMIQNKHMRTTGGYDDY